MKAFVLGAAASLAAAGTAMAGEEILCPAQFSLEDHVLLEWAGVGGDPHAQMTLAQCAFPEGAGDMSEAQRVYAIKWTTIALCEARASDVHDDRDLRLRTLKDDAHISFRRFGGMQKGEKLNWRERDFVEYRKEQTAALEARHQRLMTTVSPNDMAAARAEIADQYSRIGSIGLLKLAELSSCDSFGASKEFEAAAWSAASESWRGAEQAGVYASADTAAYDLPNVATEKTRKLSGPERRTAALEKERLLRTNPERLAIVEKKARDYESVAAINSLENFRLPVATTGKGVIAGIADAAADASLTEKSPLTQRSSLTTALQFALESLGHVEFINGPDNDYGPTTRAAVARMQAASGSEPTSVLTSAQARQTICRAAIKDDPVSLYHVALMHRNGWGFPQDDAKAAAAIARSETAMIAALGGSGLPEWKRTTYQTYAGLIRSAAADMKKPDLVASAPSAICE
ncbi:MAG: peptidoglycan-binding domain-containing protein [Parvularculaceae bacterium]